LRCIRAINASLDHAWSRTLREIVPSCEAAEESQARWHQAHAAERLDERVASDRWPKSRAPSAPACRDRIRTEEVPGGNGIITAPP